MSRDVTRTLKGVSIFLILICHLFGYFGNGIVIFTPLGGIGVSMFVFLSAYGLNESWKKSQQTRWWRKRLVAVVLPYAIVQLILFWSHNHFSIWLFIKDVFLVEPQYIYGWYLNYIMLWYCIFYVTMRFKRLNKHKMIIFIITSVIMFIAGPEIRAEQSLSFLFGIIYSNSEKQAAREDLYGIEKGVSLIMVGIVFLALKQLNFIRESHYLFYSLVQLMIKFPIALGICIVVTNIVEFKSCTKLSNFILKYFGFFFGLLGNISYELYLLHGYILYALPKSFMGVLSFVLLLGVFSLLLNRLIILIKQKIKPIS